MAYLCIDPTSDLKTSTALVEIWREIWWAVRGGGGEKEREMERERERKRERCKWERELEVKLFLGLEGNKYG